MKRDIYDILILQKTFPALLIAFMLLISACSFYRDQVHYPPLTMNCPEQMSWRGVTPLESTRADTEELLGKPDKTGIEERDGINIAYVEYIIEAGNISKYNRDRIFFTESDKVLWIEAVVADRDESFHPIGDLAESFGSVDTVHINSNFRANSEQFDVLGGPDQIYVWSTCGVATSALIGCFTSDRGLLDCDSLSETEVSTYMIPTKDDSIKDDRMIIPTTKNVTMMLFIFPPTSLDGYNEFYKNKIPFGIWDNFMRSLRS